MRDASQRSSGVAAAGSGTSHARAALAVLAALMVLNFIDRQIVGSMFPHLEAEFGLSDRQLGWLVSI